MSIVQSVIVDERVKSPSARDINYTCDSTYFGQHKNYWEKFVSKVEESGRIKADFYTPEDGSLERVLPHKVLARITHSRLHFENKRSNSTTVRNFQWK